MVAEVGVRATVAAPRGAHARSSAWPNEKRLGQAEGALRHPVTPASSRAGADKCAEEPRHTTTPPAGADGCAEAPRHTSSSLTGVEPLPQATSVTPLPRSGGHGRLIPRFGQNLSDEFLFVPPENGISCAAERWTGRLTPITSPPGAGRRGRHLTPARWAARPSPHPGPLGGATIVFTASPAGAGEARKLGVACHECAGWRGRGPAGCSRPGD